MYAATTKDEGNAADGRFSAAWEGGRAEWERELDLAKRS